MNPTDMKLPHYALALVVALLVGACSTAPIQKGDVIEEPFLSSCLCIFSV